MLQEGLSVPVVETKVRIDWACADTTGSVTASASAAAMTMAVRVMERPPWVA